MSERSLSRNHILPSNRPDSGEAARTRNRAIRVLASESFRVCGSAAARPGPKHPCLAVLSRTCSSCSDLASSSRQLAQTSPSSIAPCRLHLFPSRSSRGRIGLPCASPAGRVDAPPHCVGERPPGGGGAADGGAGRCRGEGDGAGRWGPGGVGWGAGRQGAGGGGLGWWRGRLWGGGERK